jgi:hypothetical protein
MRPRGHRARYGCGDDPENLGYVALAFDSLGDASMCKGRAATEMLDAYDAPHYLGRQSFVAGSRVTIIGWSMTRIVAPARVPLLPRR